ncbi:ester cyclase [Streptomyces sp. BI20]|uniref:ester cyclase n=1 Tax=Streptomyces sp. BI20 TaxID=3403460 RepID=UPI003C748C93
MRHVTRRARRALPALALAAVVTVAGAPAQAANTPGTGTAETTDTSVATDQAAATQLGGIAGWTAVAFFYTSLSTGETRLMERAVTDDWEDLPTHPGLGTGVPAAQRLVREVRGVFPDLVENITRVRRDGDRIEVSLLHCGTHSAEFAGVPATHKYVCFRGEETQTITGGRISRTEHWEDIEGFLKEVGK